MDVCLLLKTKHLMGSRAKLRWSEDYEEVISIAKHIFITHRDLRGLRTDCCVVVEGDLQKCISCIYDYICVYCFSYKARNHFYEWVYKLNWIGLSKALSHHPSPTNILNKTPGLLGGIGFGC